MLFIHTIDKVMSGQKTQTCRLCKAGDEAVLAAGGEVILVRRGGRAHICVGCVVAVQRGRGQKAIGHIRVMRIRLVDVRNLTDDELLAELGEEIPGWHRRTTFMHLWMGMHDKSGQFRVEPEWDTYSAQDRLYDELTLHSEYIRSRPAEYYAAWALDFEKVIKYGSN